MKLKDTLLMPKTSFNMKASLAHNEPKFQKNWEETKVYQQVMEKNEGKPLFILHDGPPYANGDLHAGHAFNKTLKDFIIRSKNMAGFKAPMIMGWDTHGLPIENALLKKGKVKMNKLTTLEFRNECSKYAMDQVAKQKDQFFELGLMADRDLFYVTLDKEYEAEQIRVFSKLVKNHIIYKGLKPVYWSPTSQSALAEAEIEYQEKTSPAIYVAMDLIDDARFEAVEIVIWTTTPWTIPANRGVAVNEEFKYAVIEVDGRKLLIATDLIESVIADIGATKFTLIKEYFGSELEGVSVRHPFLDMTNSIMIGHHVTVDSGTGCVHIAPGHGEDDFIIAKKNDIEVVSVVDAFGKMNENAGEFMGEFYENANKLIGGKLESKGKLLNLKFLKHSYPHDWRTKKPVIFRATDQWFASITSVKELLLREIESIDFQHDWGRVRLYNMIKGRDEWCISRQRKWGVPIPIFYTEKGEPIMDHYLINHIANLFEFNGSNIWFEKTAKQLLPVGFTHPDSPNGIFTKEEDIMDVWFDSGSSHSAVNKRLLGQYQSDLYFEGSDQYRGWFNSSIITGFITDGKSPFKKLISHGFVLDGKGIKMSKSIGNVVTPKQITTTKGADILRLWVASVDYQSDVRISDEIINQVSEIYRRFRNTTKFILGNLNNFKKTDVLDYQELTDVDKYMILKLDVVITECIQAYENYEFKKIVDVINNYITIELSSFYLDFSKDIIYIKAEKDLRRRQVQSVLYLHLDALLKLMAPILPHTTYEAYNLFHDESIFLTDFPNVSGKEDDSLVKLFNEFLLIRTDINKAIEEKRNLKTIGKSLECQIDIFPTEKTKAVLSKIDNIDLLCIVSKINIVDIENGGMQLPSGTILVTKFDHTECQRCRKYFIVDETTTITLEEDHVVCLSCHDIITKGAL